MKIAIIGKMGSGKSTFATKLGKALNIEVTHMDKIYHRVDWTHISRQELINKIAEILQKKEWIIDGNYQHTINQRLDAADTIVFFDIPKIVCLLRAFKRTIKRNPDVNDKVEGLADKISWKLIQLILTYKRDEVLKKLESLKKTKAVYIIKNDSDIRTIITKLKG